MPRAKQSEKRRSLKRGEILAMHPEAIRRDERGAFFFLFGPSIARNERTGQDDKVAVVNVRGPLDQFSDCWGDNYESITNRVIEAMTGVDQVRELKRKRQEAYWMGETDELDRSDIDPVKPASVVLRLSSPGGVVAGLWECVKKLRALSKQHDIPLIAYVDEMAASAAYALACACDTVYLPESGIVGSIGVISHMFSIARANEEDGIDVEVIASGDQKADGNENLPITDDAKAREMRRVMKLARQFFGVVADARELDESEIQAFQAGIFLGSDGVRSGLADGVMGWDEFIAEKALAPNGKDVPRLAQVGTRAKGDREMRLQTVIAGLKKQLATARGAERKALQDQIATLTAALGVTEAYKKTTKKMEETKEESEDPPEEEESEDDEKDKDADDDAESEESDEDAEGDDKDKDAEGDDDKKESKRSRKSDDDAESEDDKKDAEGDDADDEALLASIRDPKKRGQLAARLGEARAGRQALAEVRKLASERKREKRNALIESKLAGHFITKSEAKWLKTQPAATVSSFLATRKKPILRTDETAEIPSDTGRPDVAAHISDQEFKMIEAAYLASGGKVSLEKFVEDFKRGAHKPNGVAGAHTTPNGGSR